MDRDTALVQACDGGEVELRLLRDVQPSTAYLDIIGTVVDARTLKMMAVIELGDDAIDMKLANDVVEVWHDPRFAKVF